jgi:hypothetical protein
MILTKNHIVVCSFIRKIVKQVQHILGTLHSNNIKFIGILKHIQTIYVYSVCLLNID